LHHRRGERNSQRWPGAGHPERLTLHDRLLLTLAWLRLATAHEALALFYGVDRSTVSAAIRQIRPLLANRGFATPSGPRLHTLADVLAHAAAEGLTVRLDRTEIQVRRPKANRPGRRAWTGKKKQNTIKATVASDAHGRPFWAGAIRPTRQHDQTAVRTEGIDDLLDAYPDVQFLGDAGYRGLAKDHPRQAIAPPLKPKKDARPTRSPPTRPSAEPSPHNASPPNTRSRQSNGGAPCNASPAAAMPYPRPSGRSQAWPVTAQPTDDYRQPQLIQGR
jgi:Helix-turn-helix of DDE superfamily endonuclease/DDE superfamily endonuclease